MDFLETVYAPIPIGSFYPAPSQLKAVLLVIPDTENAQRETIIFTKMFERLALTLEEHCHLLMVLPDHRYSYISLLKDYGFNKLILCGINPFQLGLQSSLPIHIPVHLNGVFILRTDAPLVLENSHKEHKGGFWQAFKSAFEV